MTGQGHSSWVCTVLVYLLLLFLTHVCGGGGHLAKLSFLLPHGPQRTQVVRAVLSAYGH